ncbi:MAG: LysM peptidoglycan-binding domain-containing protein [Coprobacillus sp.]
MQKIYFNKLVDLNHKLKELVSISVDESINYKMENQGMRAVGSVIINGEYKDQEEKNAFQESIDLDILATFDKISDKRDFHVKVEDFDYSFQEGNLMLVIQACIYGVIDDEDRVIETTINREKKDEDVVEEIEQLLREEEIEVNEPVEEKKIIEEEILVEKVEPKIVQEEDDDIGTYYLYIVRDGDSYQSIAAHYQCDEYKLKNYNHERSLSKGTIVIIPYYS